MESKQIANQLALPVLGKARVAGLAPDFPQETITTITLYRRIVGQG